MKSVLHTPETIYSLRHAPSWFLLAGAAGAVNGIAFIECEQYISHVTGTVTRMSLEWPTLGEAAEFAALLLSFLIGAVTSVLMIQTSAHRGDRPRWDAPLLVVVLILVGVSLAGQVKEIGWSGGTHATAPPPVVLLSALAFAMGLQNAAVASMTGMVVRTTHLTGSTTDLGIDLGIACLSTGAERRAAVRGTLLRGGKITAFVLGAGLSLPLAKAFGLSALLVPATLVATATALSFSPRAEKLGKSV